MKKIAVSRRIIRVKAWNGRYRYWFVVQAKTDESGSYVMEAVRLRKGDYALYHGKGIRMFLRVSPEDISILDDAEALKMTRIYNTRKLAL